MGLDSKSRKLCLKSQVIFSIDNLKLYIYGKNANLTNQIETEFYNDKIIKFQKN
jgi:hypothetical protein